MKEPSNKTKDNPSPFGGGLIYKNGAATSFIPCLYLFKKKKRKKERSY